MLKVHWGVDQSQRQDFQALCILFARYLVALVAPTVKTPETACLTLETMTLRLKIFSTQFAASVLDFIKNSTT